MNFNLTGNIVDIEARNIYVGTVEVQDGKIIEIKTIGAPDQNLDYILPGFIDAHVHIESSMLLPSEFARLAVVHGTVGTVSDPHEIANVCGIEGVRFMIENGKEVHFKFHFGAPSCVPATIFETAGASLDSEAIAKLMALDEISYLSEMMNFPGVLHGDEEVRRKILLAEKNHKPVDGHAPGLRGTDLKKYVQGGMARDGVLISTDHECFTKDEAEEKLKLGVKILIREGSAAKNFEALVDLLNDYPFQMMFCSDDKHPDSLVKGHINQLCKRALNNGIDLFHVLQAACVNPVKHYKMNVGLLKPGDPADFIIVKDLSGFEVLSTFIDGIKVAEGGITKITAQKSGLINNFHCSKKEVEDFKFAVTEFPKTIEAIVPLDGQLITNKQKVKPIVEGDHFLSDTENDILKIVVVNRYHNAPIAKAFIRNFGLKKGAIASSVAHDSHNIIAVGVDEQSLCEAVNLLIEKQGGISCVNGSGSPGKVLALPVAGLMSNEDGYQVAKAYIEIDQAAKELGSQLSSPFMTLSFMALLVIPHLKISDLGLFDADSFTFVN